jgi:hypothetical protein
MRYSGKLEYAHARKIRERNTVRYRFAHWPLWITVFFLAPGPLTFSLFAHGFGWGNGLWLALVLLGTGIAGLRAQLPGVELRPYILRFDEDKHNPLYRRVCYTFAWNAAVNFALMNLIGLVIASVTGVWYMSQIYRYAYLPVCLTILILGAAACRPLHQRRRIRAPLLLRHSLGGHSRSNRPPRTLEDSAQDTGSEPGEASHLSRSPAAHGHSHIPGQAAPHASYRSGRTDG